MAGSIEMLRSRGDFDAFAAGSRSRANEMLVMRYRRNELDVTRYGISTSRRLGTAVARNRIRRRLRTVLREIDGGVERGWDVLLVARPAAASASQAELAGALTNLLAAARLTGDGSVSA